MYPYLLRRLQIDRAQSSVGDRHHHIPMARGFVYLVAVIDWYTRKVLSNTLTTDLPISVSRRWRRHWRSTARLRSSTPIRAVHEFGVHQRAQAARHPYQHGWQGALA